MFLKLCKLEFKDSCRGYLFAYVLMLLSSLFLRVNSNDVNVLLVIAVIIYTGTIFALMIMIFVNIYRNYHKTMFTKEAYLTHTLPVSSKALLSSKVLVSVLWYLISFIVIFISIFLIILMSGEVNISDIFDMLGHVFQNLSKIPAQFFGELIHLGIGLVEFILSVFFIMNLMHTRFIPIAKNLIGVVMFFFIMFIKEYFVTIVGVQILSLDQFTLSWSLFNIAIDLVLSCLYYFGSIYLLNNKVDIE